VKKRKNEEEKKSDVRILISSCMTNIQFRQNKHRVVLFLPGFFYILELTIQIIEH